MEPALELPEYKRNQKNIPHSIGVVLMDYDMACGLGVIEQRAITIELTDEQRSIIANEIKKGNTVTAVYPHYKQEISYEL